MVSLNINVSELPESTFDLIPEGKYPAMIADVEPKISSKGDQYLNLTWELLEQYRGRKVWQMIFITHSNTDFLKRNLEMLGAICRASGIATLKESDQLLGQNALVKIKIEEGKDGYDDKNKITSVKALEGSAPPSAMPPAAAKSDSPPWGRK